MGFSYKGLAGAASERGRRLANDHGKTASHLVGQAGDRLQAVARDEQVQEVGFALIEGFLGPRASAAAEKAAAGRLRTPAKKATAKKATAKKSTAKKPVARKTAATAAGLPPAEKGSPTKKGAAAKKAVVPRKAVATENRAASPINRKGRKVTT